MPLDKSRASIRLLEVLPRQHEGHEIQCNIRHVIMDDIPKYTALSYEWGRPDSARHTIRLNGAAFRVRENLFSFLEHALSSEIIEGHTNLWIDAICINQDDVKEKNHQVHQMKSIYQNAVKVLAWVGPSTRKIDQLFGFIRERGRLAGYEGETHWATRADGFPGYLCVAVGDIASRAYFSRLWVVQELLLCNTVYLVCGTHSISFENWSSIWIRMSKFSDRVGYHLPNKSCCDRLVHMRSIRPGTAPHDEIFTILGLVQSFRYFFASHPCDTVYALLGLALDSDKIHIDYGAPIEFVLFDLLLSHPNLSCAMLHSYLSIFLSIFHTDYSKMLQIFDTSQNVSQENALTPQISRFEADVLSPDEPPTSQGFPFECTLDWNLMLHKAAHEPSVRLGLQAYGSAPPEGAKEYQEWMQESPAWKAQSQASMDLLARKPLILCACMICEPTRVGLAAKLLNHSKAMKAFEICLNGRSGSRRCTTFMLFHQQQYMATGFSDGATVIMTCDSALSIEQIEIELQTTSHFEVTASLCHLLHLWCLADDATASKWKAARVPLCCEEGKPVTLGKLKNGNTISTSRCTKCRRTQMR